MLIKIKYLLLHFVLILTNWMPDYVFCLRFRGFLASFFFAECGSNFRLGRNVTFYNPSNIFIGSNVYIAYGNWFCAHDKIIIHDEVMFGPNSIVVNGNHSRKNKSFRYGPIISKKKIVIESGVWVGGNCNILSGSYIGSGTVISAGSNIFKRIPKNSKVINGKIIQIQN